MHKMRSASGSRHGSLLNSGGMVGSVYVMESGRKCIMTWMSSNIVLYGVLFIVHSSSDIVKMVIVSWFFCAAKWVQCMAFCMFSLLCGWAYLLFIHLHEKAVPLDPNIESL